MLLLGWVCRSYVTPASRVQTGNDELVAPIGLGVIFTNARRFVRLFASPTEPAEHGPRAALRPGGFDTVKCPVCAYAFTFGEFCRLTNPSRIRCPRCGSLLKIAGLRAIVSLIILAAIVYLIPGTLLSDLAPVPLNYAVLALLGLVFLFGAGYLVFRYCELERQA